MVNLFEIARQAQSGTWFDAASRQFGLQPAQTQRAVEALLPAFTLAFQRNAMNPAAFGNLLGMVGSGQYAPFYDTPGFGRPGAGETVLTQLFGSRQVTDAVAAQASAVSGIGVQILQQMLPALAATLIGGMFRYASVEGFADLLRQWSDAIKAARPLAAPPKAADPWSAWADTVGAMMGSSPFPQTPTRPVDPVSGWFEAVSAMLGGAGKAPPPPPPSRPNPFEAISRMFETGREVQAQHLAGLQAIMGGTQAPADPR